MIVGFVNAVLATDTSNWDKGLGRAGQGISSLRSQVNTHSTGISEALNGMGQLSGLGGAISGAFGKIVNTITQAKMIVTGTVSAFTHAAGTLTSPFTYAASKIYSAFASIASFVGRPLMIVITAVSISAAVNALAKVASLAVKPITIPVSFGWGALTSAAQQAGAVIVAGIGESWQAIMSMGAAGVAALGGLILTGAARLVGALSGFALAAGSAIAAPLTAMGSTAIAAVISTLGALVSALPGFLASMIGPFVTFSSAVTAIGIDIAKAFMMAIPEIAFLGASFVHLGPMFIMTLEQIGSAALTLLQPAIAAFAEFGSVVVQSLGTIASVVIDFGARAYRVMAVLIPGLADIFASLFPRTAETMAAIWSFAVNTFSAIGSAVADFASKAASVLGTFASTAASFLGDTFVFLGGLLANIPFGGVGIAIVVVVVSATALAAALASVGAAAFGAIAVGVSPVIFAITVLESVAEGTAAALALLTTGLGLGGALAATPIGLGLIVGGLLAATAAAAGLTGALWHMASAGAESISTLTRLARELGMTTQAMAALGTIGGLSADTFSHGMVHMQRAVEEMGAATSQALARIHLNPNDLRGLDAEQQLRAIAQGFSALTSQGERAAVAMALFGRGAGADMIEPLSRGVGELDRLSARAQRFGLTFTEAQAQAVRAANREWAGFGQAMEGIRRQGAVLFAPLWEWIGRIGGQVGEWLVERFQRFSSMAQAAIPEIQAVAMNLWTSISAGAGGVVAQIRQLGAEWGLTFDSIEDIAITGVAAVIVAFRNLPATWEIITGRLRLGWLTFLEAIKEPFSVVVGGLMGIWQNLGSAWALVIAEFKVKWLEFVRSLAATFRDAIVAILSFLGAPVAIIAHLVELSGAAGIQAQAEAIGRTATIMDEAANIIGGGIAFFDNLDGQIANARIDLGRGALNIRRDIEAAQNSIRQNWFGDLNAQIEDLTRQLNANLGVFGGDVARLAQQLRDAMRRVRQEMGQPLPVPALDVGMTRAYSGHETALAGSERAFSLLYNRGGTENYLQQQQLQRQTEIRDLERQTLQALQRAPAIRRANF